MTSAHRCVLLCVCVCMVDYYYNNIYLHAVLIIIINRVLLLSCLGNIVIHLMIYVKLIIIIIMIHSTNFQVLINDDNRFVRFPFFLSNCWCCCNPLIVQSVFAFSLSFAIYFSFYLLYLSLEFIIINKIIIIMGKCICKNVCVCVYIGLCLFSECGENFTHAILKSVMSI